MLKLTLFVSAVVAATVMPATSHALNLGLFANSKAASHAKRLPSNYPLINSILINPKSGNHESAFIYLKCPASFNFAGGQWAIVVVENENGGGSTDGRGTIDNIIPLTGAADSNGNYVVRECDSHGNLQLLGTGTAPAADPFLGQSCEQKMDFSESGQTIAAWDGTSGHTLTYGGNGLENAGGNYFLVKGLNYLATQQTGSGNSKVNGTTLDSNPGTSDGTFDYQNGTSGAFTLFSGTGSGIYDGFYVGEGSDDNGNVSPTTSLDYVTNCTMVGNATKAVWPLMASGNWTYNTAGGTKTAADYAHTPDYICRLWNSSTFSTNTLLTHTSLDKSGNSVTISDTFGTELNSTSGNGNQFFKQSSGCQALWDLTDESSMFSSTLAYGIPGYAFSLSSTYYHP